MKNTVSSFLIMILIALVTILSSTFIYAHQQAVNARNFNTNSIDRIQASDFNESVINDVVQKGTEQGYDVTIENETVYETKPEYLVKTKYKVGITSPTFGNSIVIGYPAEVEGYAR